MKASEWIDRVKKAHGWDSDYRVAKELGLSRATVSKYRSRTPTLDDDSAIKVATALGESPELVLLDQTMERTKNDEARHALAGLIKRLGGVAAGLVVAVGAVSGPSPAEARTASPSPASSASSLYIMLSKRRRKPGVFDAIRDALTGNTPVFA